MSEDLRSTLNAFLYRTGESSRKYGFLSCHVLIKRGCIIKVTAFGLKREPKSPGNEVASQLTATSSTENTITDHNALCLSPQNFA